VSSAFIRRGKPWPAFVVLGLGLPLDDVLAAALHEVARQLLAQRIALRGAVLQFGESRVQQ
jgi:hypothetical protein